MTAAKGNRHGFAPGNKARVPAKWRYSKANRMREQAKMVALLRFMAR